MKRRRTEIMTNRALGNLIPMSFNDAVFTRMTEKTAPDDVPAGTTVTNWSIVETTGDPSLVMNNNSRFKKSRINSRECVRLGSGNQYIDQCYLESTGSGADHADTLQAYSPGTRGALVQITNTYIRAHNTSATAGYFTADDWGGTIRITNCIFHGGPYGFWTYADPSCHVDIYFQDVFFVEPFGTGPILVTGIGSGTFTIQHWANVRSATIVNGAIVPGSLLAAPT